MAFRILTAIYSIKGERKRDDVHRSIGNDMGFRENGKKF